MRIRTKVPVVTLVAVGALLLAALAVIFAPPAQTVYAQELSLSVSLGEDSLPQGGSTYLNASVYNLPRDPNNQYNLPELTYRQDLFRVLSDESTENANGCANGMGGNTPVNSVYDNPKNFGGGWDNFTINSDCPTGSYRVRMSVKHKDASTDLVFGTRDFTVVPGPSVTVELPSASFYRGVSGNVTMTFNHLPAGANLSYRAYVMQRNPANHAYSCEGAGLGAQVAMNSVSNTEVRNGTIAAACPTAEYKLTVVLYNSSNSKLITERVDFEIVTDPDATPSVTIDLSSRSVAPGTEIDATISFYDLQGDSNTSLDYLAEVTKIVNSEEVDANDCEGTWLGQEMGTGVSRRNPMVFPAKIVAACPVGQYTLKASMSNPSHTVLASGAVNFEITNSPQQRPSQRPSGGNSNNGGGNSNNGGGNSNNGGGNSNNGGGNSNNGGGNSNTGSPPQTFFRSAPPQTSAQQQSSTPIAITLPEIMNVRSGPGLNYEVVATVAAGTQARIIGIGAQDDWYQVEIDGVEGPVWIYQDLTTLSGSLAGVKRYTSAEIALLLPGGGSGDGVPLAITVPITMNVRSGPGLTYDVVRVVPVGTQGPIYGIDPDDEWFQIELDGLDTLAWVYQDLTTVVGSLAGVRRITEQEIAMLPAAVTQPQLLNVRSGPGTDYDVLAIVPQGTWARIIGIDTQAEWYQVELAELEEPAWLFRGLTKVAGGSLAGLIQIASVDGPSPPSGSTYQELTNSITVDLALRQAGGVDLEVSWSDSGACTQLYNLYHRRNVSSDTYLSLETAATASTTNSKSLSFQTLSGSSFISAWCGTKSDGRQVAEVEIDPGVAGTYSSTSPASDGIAAVVPPR